MIRVLDNALGSRRYVGLLRVISVAVWLLALILWFVSTGGGFSIRSLPLYLKIPANVFAGVVELIAIPGSILLWVSVIYYWRHFDTLTAAWKRAVWFIVVLFGFCFGASIYCWLRVRQVALGGSKCGS